MMTQQTEVSVDTGSPEGSVDTGSTEESKKEQLSLFAGDAFSDMFNNAFGIQKEETSKQEEVVEETEQDSTEQPQEANTEETEKEEQKPVQEEQEAEDPVAKQLEHAQKMLGKQAQEVGELRKEIEELRSNKTEAVKETDPYWKQLVDLSKEDIAASLMSQNKDMAEDEAYSKADVLKTSAQIARDMLEAELKPFKQATQQQEELAKFNQEAEQFLKDHPEYETRQPYMKKFISQVYPDGVSLDKQLEVAKIAYAAAEHMMQVSTSTTDNVAKTLSSKKKALNSSTSASVQTAAPPKKVSPFDAMLEKAYFNQG